MKIEPASVLEEIVLILDRPAHAGNIGAAVRAMSNTGFRRLRLVAPRQFPHADAVNFAAGAASLLDGVERFDDMAGAVADLNVLVATSNRPRGQRQTVLTPRELGPRLRRELTRPGTRVGLLFGTERTGLETVDVERADILCNIPTAGSHGSLNLAQAVMVVTYELMLGLGAGDSFRFDPHREGPRASAAELARLFEHMESVLYAIGFLAPKQKRHMMGSLRALFHRAALDSREVSILRGIWHEVIASRDRPLC